MKPQDRLIISEQERESVLWKRIRSHYDKRLSTMRSKNDGPLGNEETLVLRGRIHEIKTLLSLGDAIALPNSRE
jgi:hypothetical protein